MVSSSTFSDGAQATGTGLAPVRGCNRRQRISAEIPASTLHLEQARVTAWSARSFARSEILNQAFIQNSSKLAITGRGQRTRNQTKPDQTSGSTPLRSDRLFLHHVLAAHHAIENSIARSSRNVNDVLFQPGERHTTE